MLVSSSSIPTSDENETDETTPLENDSSNGLAAKNSSSAGLSKTNFRNDAFYVVVSRVIGIGATMAGHMLASRWLGPDEYGKFLLLSTVIALGSIFAMRGLNEAGLRFLAENLAKGKPGLAHSFLIRIATSLLVNSLLTVGVFAAGILLFHVFIRNLGHPVWLVSLTSAGIFLLAWQQVAAESLRGYGELKLASFYSGGQTGGPISNIIFLCLFGVAAISLAQVSLVGAVLMMVIAIMLTIPFAWRGLWKTSQKTLQSLQQKRPDEIKIEPEQLNSLTVSEPRISGDQGRELKWVGSVLMLNQILAFGTYQFDIWLGGALLDGGELGYYGAAKRALLLVSLPLQMAMMTVLPVVPRMRAQNRTKELERFLRSTATYAAVPSMLALTALLFFPETILGLIFGSEYVAAVPIALVMIVGHVVMIVSGNPPYILAMTGQQKTVVYVNLVAALSMAIFGTVGALYFGGVGLAVGSSMSLIVQHGLLWWMAHRKLNIWTHLGIPIVASRESVDVS